MHTYTVRRGESLGSLAEKFRTPARDIARLSGIPPDATVYQGQELRIPVAALREPPEIPAETLSRLYGLSPDKIVTTGEAAHLLFLPDRRSAGHGTVREFRSRNGE